MKVYFDKQENLVLENGADRFVVPREYVGDVEVTTNEVNEGLCPICYSCINDGAIICDKCFGRAKSYRERYG